MDGRAEAQGLRPKAQEAQEAQEAREAREAREALRDSQLDREIESAVGIEPSPEFLARVRTRIASEPERLVESGFSRICRLSFEPLAGVAIAGIVLAVVVPQFMRDETARPQLMPSPVANISAPPVHPVTAAPQLTVARPPRQLSAVVDVAEAPRTLPLQLSPVLFAEEDRVAFAWFVTAVADGTVPEEVVRSLGEEEMTSLAIAPLVIDPLPPLARVERQGEGQW